MRCRARTCRASRTLAYAASGMLAMAVLASPAGAEPAFYGVGDLPGGDVTSSALAVSADGGTVVGGSDGASGPEAVRWTPGGGLQPLGSLSGGDFYSVATGVSADGSVVAGTSHDGDFRAFRWTAGSGMVGLGRFSCGFGCSANPANGEAISGDGSTVVGSGAGASFFVPFVEAARWPGGGTSIDGIGHLSGGGDASVAQGVSFDGSVIVGDSDSGDGNQGFVWTSSTGMDPLPGFPGAQTNSKAMGVSADGTVVVGGVNTSASGTQQVEAARWLGAGWSQLELLGALPGATLARSRAHAASGDGALVVGSATNDQGKDAAFVWDAIHGMRDLREVLIEDYGLPVEDWTLTEARGISDVDPSGTFVVVGTGVNPAGDPEGWVAVLEPVACSDGLDNDGDGLADFPADPGCLRRSDPTEQLDCVDGVDNDGDGDVDGADADCLGPADASEVPDCADGFDNDGDGLADGADPGCRDASGPVEDPACDDGVDNDADGRVDFPFDVQCVAADDASEEPDCSDGLDNDGDGLLDAADPDCTGALDPSEDPPCSDRVDNDGDFRIDFPDAFPACESAADPSEAPQCSDGVDNDGDGQTDFPADAGCTAADAATESPGTLDVGELVVSDARAAHVFALDPASGTMRLLSSGLQLTAPTGVAQRGGGEIAVADPAGLVELDPVTGAQRRLSGPLDVQESLQVVFDAAGDAIVLERDRLSRVTWVLVGLGAKATFLPVPSPDGNLGAFAGFSLAREADGSYLVTGLGIPNNGIHRVDPITAAVSAVTPGLNPYLFYDLAVEASGQILAVGNVTGTGTGVFRVDPASGALAVLSVDPAWTYPTAVAVGAGGDVFVADAGTCDAAGCSGGEIVRVDPASGARLQAWTGPLVTGEMDLAVITTVPACRNGVDDDGDGAVDHPQDADCPGPSHPTELPACSDGLDNDGDGAIDYPDDVGCPGANARKENPACSDGVENDFDGLVDYDGAGLGDPDPECGQPFFDNERRRACGLGVELALLLPLWAAARRRARAERSAAPCMNNVWSDPS